MLVQLFNGCIQVRLGTTLRCYESKNLYDFIKFRTHYDND